MANKREGNRQQRREEMNERLRQQQLEEMSKKSLPTHKIMLDYALSNLHQTITMFKELGWTVEEMNAKVQAYADIYEGAKVRHDEVINNRELSEQEVNGDFAVILQEVMLTRYEHDLRDEAVNRTIEFLDSAEGKGLAEVFGFA